MKKLFFPFLLSIPCIAFSQQQLNGKVIDAHSKEALTGANVRIIGSYNATYTNADGAFNLSRINKESFELLVSFIGFQTDTVLVDLKKETNITISLNPKTYQSEEVIVSSTRANENAPATSTNVSKEEINANNLGQDLPYLLQQTPSVVTTSDAGAGVGYTGIRIRGSDASRINVTINGVPLNDAESHGVFWVNMPDFASSLNSVQIQRGVGTSTNGAGAFGASINLETSSIRQKSFAEINNSFGSFNTRKHTLKFGSGLIDDKFSFEGRLSQINSDGYIDRASSDLQSYFLSGSYVGEKTIIKGVIFGGREITYQSWYGTPESRINNDREAMLEHASNEWLEDFRKDNLLNSGRTYNYYLYKNQVDNYSQKHYQLHFSHAFSNKITANLSLHYTKGSGYYEEYKRNEALADYNIQPAISGFDTTTHSDLIRRRWLDNDFYGLTYSVIYTPNNKLDVTIGGGINNYEGDHFGRVIWAETASNSFPTQNYYFNEGDKLDGNTFIKASYYINKRVQLFGDLQYRRIEYSVEGVDNDQRSLKVDEEFNFVNPKLGLSYQLSNATSFYTLFAVGHREPNRADFVDQPANTPKQDANKAEKLYNLEVGGEHRANKYKLGVNFYFMAYEDQLVSTGQLNDVGSPLRQNVDESYRAGIEIQSAILLSEKLSWKLNASFSNNKISSFESKIYDENGVIIEKHGKTNIALSPEIIASSEIQYYPSKNIELAFISRYIGEQFLDNTSNKNSIIEAYFVNDFRLQYTVPNKLIKNIKIQALINNVFSEKYSSNGYTYSYIYNNTRTTENFYYPQAFRNYLIGLNLSF
jgi:iron complex outermembrane receptor protein